MIELVAIIIGTIFLLILMHYVSQQTSRLNRAYFQKKWQEIRVLQRTSAAGKRLAIIEADKLLDHAMKDCQIKGDNMGERLKNAGYLIGHQSPLWSAHKLRNKIVHEETAVKPVQVRQALSAYETALKKLGAF